MVQATHKQKGGSIVYGLPNIMLEQFMSILKEHGAADFNNE
jgi:hypothetical protein